MKSKRTPAYPLGKLFSAWLAVALLGIPGLAPSAPATAGEGPKVDDRTERVSLASDGTEGNTHSGQGSFGDTTRQVSKNGRHVVFPSAASSLVPGETNDDGECGTDFRDGSPIPCVDIFARDRVTGTTERVSVASDGTQGNSHSASASISADGRYVVFESSASNLVPDDTNETRDIFVHDRETGETERVSVAGNGTEADATSEAPDISADSRYVVFHSSATNLVPGDTNFMWDIFVHDRESGATERVSVTSEGAEVTGQSTLASISGDGRYVAFTNWGPGLVLEDTNNAPDVFLHDRETRTTERVSVGTGGTQSNAYSDHASISGDGAYVAFDSQATNLVPQDSNGQTGDIFVHDLEAGVTERVTLASDGREANGASWSPAISADGRFVVFLSQSNNLDPNQAGGVFVHDRATGRTEKASLTAGGEQPNGPADQPSMSPDGRHVVFASAASNIVSGYTNRCVNRGDPNPIPCTEVYIRDIGPPLGVGDLVATAGPEGVDVSGWANLGGVTVAAADDPVGDDEPSGSGKAGADLTDVNLTYRPREKDLLVRIGMAELPASLKACPPVCQGPPGAAGLPGILYGLAFELGAARYELRAAREASGVTFVLHECTDACAQVAALGGSLGAGGRELRASIPLEAFGGAEAALLRSVEAFSATGDTQNGATTIHDDVALPDAALPVSAIHVGIAPSGTPEDQVGFGTQAEAGGGTFSGGLDTSALAPGEYDVWARGCVGTECGSDHTSVTLVSEPEIIPTPTPTPPGEVCPTAATSSTPAADSDPTEPNPETSGPDTARSPGWGPHSPSGLPPFPEADTSVTAPGGAGPIPRGLLPGASGGSASPTDPGTIRTYAGGGFGDDLPATQASLWWPLGVDTDPAGNLFIADTGWARLRRVDKDTGIGTTVAGIWPRGYGGDGGPAKEARLSNFVDLEVGPGGDLYLADTYNNRIRKVEASTGTISTIAGIGTDVENNMGQEGTAVNGDGGQAKLATLAWPGSLTLDSQGHLYIAEFSAQRIRMVDLETGIITTVAGTGKKGYSGDGGPATQAQLRYPSGLALDPTEKLLYVSDWKNNRLRMVNLQTGVITTVAGDGTKRKPGETVAEQLGDGGPATEASLQPAGVDVDGAGNVYITDFENARIRRVDAGSGVISTVAGGGTFDADTSPGDGGPATDALLKGSWGVDVDAAGNIYIADQMNDAVRRVDAQSGIITTVAGTGGGAGFSGYFGGDGGPATNAALWNPTDVVVDAAGNAYIADPANLAIRRVDGGTEHITTVAGSRRGAWFASFAGDCGPARNARLWMPWGVALGNDGSYYIADLGNHRVRRVDPDGIITTLAGGGESALGDGGSGTEARLVAPRGVDVDSQGNVYIADAGMHRIRKVDAATGIITTVAGSGSYGFAGDGGPATEAVLLGPLDVEVDGAGNIYLADTYNDRIRKVDAETGVITTVAGSGVAGPLGDGGPAVLATLDEPHDIAVDDAGNLFIADTYNDRIRMVDADTGIITTVAGTPRMEVPNLLGGALARVEGPFGDGGPATLANLNKPQGVDVDAAGNLYIADSFHYRVRVVSYEQAGPRR